MLLGEHEHTIDDKNRLTLPAKFRQAFSEGVVLSRGLDGCLDAYPAAEWRKLVESRLAPLDRLSREGRLMQRFFYASASEGELDKQGRVLVPPALAKRAGLEREVVVAGMDDHLEIWDRTAWRKQVDEVEGSAEHVAERLAAQGS